MCVKLWKKSRVPDHLGTTSARPRETHEVKLSSARWIHWNGFNNFLLGTILNASTTFTNRNCIGCFVICNIAVVGRLFVLRLATLLWCCSCSFCELLHCCRAAAARFMICNVVLVPLLLVLQCSILLWLQDSLQVEIAQWGWQIASAMARGFLTKRNCPVRVADHLGITSASPRHHPGITSSEIRKHHDVKLSSARWVYSNGFNNFFFELSFC